ncbi:MAG: pyruvate, phosphate dikinase [Candidatus Acididesulfobacter guangdongensis]|uniref:Pyruvate, phosphate dikinase n=1 Tax=Acididesulfobacter guangdongensis TaxID=2597225 RepID=A0A519BG78_ACIG2|nr:MAG: pyruvate, phosphate dikinase [Candidatus Acididesulfobacter guangdongensis]
MAQYVYFFGNKYADGDGSMKNLLGGKGAGLAEMTKLGIRVPAGFTITTEVCTYFYEHGRKYPEDLENKLQVNLETVEKTMGTKFGDAENPLLVSVRSGARISMPGMMDTVLNLGLNDETIKGLIKKSGNERFAYDTYRRFIQMFSNVVLGLDSKIMESILEKKKKEKNVHNDNELSAPDLKELVYKFKDVVKEQKGIDFPDDPYKQLWMGISAVFESWNVPRAITYRKLNHIPEDWGTAVNVVSMVYGNMGNNSGTGVAFTRNPSTGENGFYGEYLINAQGEDVVAGIRTPQPINNMSKKNKNDVSLEEALPSVYKELIEYAKILENHYKDMLDLEFTIQEGILYMLQVRSGKRTAKASVRIALDMYNEGLIDKKTAVLRVDPNSIVQLLYPSVDPKSKKDVIAKGLPASPGAASGEVVFSAEEAEAESKKGKKVILVRMETSPEDIHGMSVSEGILTARGGMTSHAAVVARGMGKCAITGCSALEINEKKGEIIIGERVVKKGDTITLNGSTGEVYYGNVDMIRSELNDDFLTIMGFANGLKKLKIRANADTPEDAKVARNYSAEGIGLCRTEHMFFKGDRIKAVREMILADSKEEREKALRKLLPMQKGDFLDIYNEMKGYSVTIRLLDPPLHEFLPKTEEEIKELAGIMNVSFDKLNTKANSLHEINPMLGHRGCRLGISYPEIYEMQVEAIMEAACDFYSQGNEIIPEIMIPVVGIYEEIRILKAMVDKKANEVMASRGVKLNYLVGTMIELPRACVIAGDIAKEAEFFSFGTNDLTQTTFGFSRDDIGSFLPDYLERNVLKTDPFIELDREGVGSLMKIAVEGGKKTRKDIKLGICGEHGGDPSSIEFCHILGLNYASCSPFRVPVAIIAAAHAAIKNDK